MDIELWKFVNNLGKVLKMNKKILLFSRDPGGANTVAPLYYKLKNKDYDVEIFGKDFALDKYKQYNINGIDIGTRIKDISQSSIEQFLIEEKPDFIITGTSADDFTEKFLWKASEKLNVKSFAILDQWVNYGIRFSKFSVNQMDEYEKDRKHPYVPFKILVMDNYAKAEMIKAGIDKDKILVSGQPYFDYLIEKKENFNKNSINYRENIGFKEDEFLLTFISEPISNIYKEDDDSEHYWGYTERTIFKQLIEVLEDITEQYKKKINIIIRLHPKEKENNYDDIIDSINSKYISILIDKKINGFKLMYSSDLIIGMSSMFLIEAAVLGKSIQSIQIGLRRENSFILDRRGILKSIICKEDLKNVIENYINKNRIMKRTLNINYGSTDRVVKFIEEYMK